MKTTSKQLLNELNKAVENHIQLIESEFLGLSEKQLNTRPAEDKWSIGECMAHLNLYAEHYNKVMEQKMHQSSKPPKPQYNSGWMGEKFTKMMAPQADKVTNPMKTINGYDPSKSDINGTQALNEQLDHLRKLTELLKLAENHNLMSIKIPITITTLIKMRLGDTFRFNEAHIHRHLLQALNVKKMMHLEPQTA